MLALLFCLLVSLQVTTARKFYVDNKTVRLRKVGSYRFPFAKIQDCIDAVKSPGDICKIKAGKYHEEVVVNGKHGTKAKPIIITGLNQERPTLDGTVLIKPIKNWNRINPSGKIYSAKIDQDITQLFIDGEMMTNARWPNSLWSDRSIFNGSYWGGLSSSSKRGVVVNKGSSLADTGIDMTGAMAILNIGSYNTFTAKVEKHVAGSNRFEYKDTFGSILYRPEKSRYFLEDKLELLDQPEEWFYDKTTKMLYVWTKDSDSPAEHELRGKVQTYGLTITNSSNLIVKDLDFFATTLQAESIDLHNTIDSLQFQSINFKFPSYSKRMLGIAAPPQWTKVSAYVRRRKVRKYGTFQINNCTFFGTDGVALEYIGINTTLRNNLFEYNDWTGANMVTKTGGKGTVISHGKGDLFIRNTLRFNGATSGYRPGMESTIRLNHVYKQCWGIIMNDGSGIHLTVPKQTNSMTTQNWVHSSPKYGLRFDGEPPKIGKHGTFKENVVFKCNGLMVKGDYHQVYNNLAFDKRDGKDSDGQGAKCMLCVLKYVRKNPGEINNNTIVIGNAADVANGGVKKKNFWPLAGKVIKDNVFGDVRKELMDADNFDFRPNRNSKYIAHNTGPYAYRNKISTYWIPGRQIYKASTPVPPNNGMNVRAQYRDTLMWLNGLGASSHDVYFGINYQSVKDAGKTSDEFLGSTSGDGNVIYLKLKLSGKQVYYWRVDAVVSSVAVYKGDIWSFTTK